MLSYSELKQQLYTALCELGLTEQQRNLYLTSLHQGPMPVVLLAKTLRISRPNVYKLISGLEEHGLARFSKQRKYARMFMVEPPTTLVKCLRKKKEAVQLLTQNVTGLLPDLYSLYQQGANQTKIRVLRTEQEYSEAVQDMLLEVDDEIYFFGSFDDFVRTVTPEGFARFTALRLERNIVSKTLILPTRHETSLWRTRLVEKRELRILKQAARFLGSFQLTRHKIILWQPLTPLAILIEDDAFAQMLQSMFDVLWETGEQK